MSFGGSANAQTPQASSVTQVSSTTEIAATLNRALDKIAAMDFQIRAVKDVVENQQRLIDALEKRDESRISEIAALKRALEAEMQLHTLETQRADLAEKRIAELLKSGKTTNRRAKFAFITGFALGFAGGRFL